MTNDTKPKGFADFIVGGLLTTVAGLCFIGVDVATAGVPRGGSLLGIACVLIGAALTLFGLSRFLKRLERTLNP